MNIDEVSARALCHAADEARFRAMQPESVISIPKM
jgi:hypothetical protein